MKDKLVEFYQQLTVGHPEAEIALMHLHRNVDDKCVPHNLVSLNDGPILLSFDQSIIIEQFIKM